MPVSAERVIQRVLLAKEFSSPEALRTYLRDHPQADKSKHTVEKGKEPKGKPDQPGEKRKSKPPPLPPKAKAEPKAPEKGPETKAKDPGKAKALAESWGKRLKGLSDSASTFMKKAPEAFQNFFGDEDFRKEAIKEARGAITQAPGKLIARLVETAKEEVHEFKTAASGVKKVLSGKKMSKHEKHAFKQVAFHMALAGTTAALAASGPLAGVAMFGQSIGKHIAIKAVSRALANVHVLEEVGHVGHGVAHLLHFIGADGKKKQQVDPEDAMTKLVLASVVKELESLTDKDYTEVLNSMQEEDQKKTAAERVVTRYLA